MPLQMPFGVLRRHLRLGFSRAVDAAERNGRSGLVKVWVASERESVVKLEGVGQWVSI